MRQAVFAVIAAMWTIACGQGPVLAQAAAPAFATSGNADFDAWRADFAQRAVSRGRSPAVVGSLLSGLAPDQRIVDLDNRQPEFVAPVWDYVTSRVSDTRIANGLQLKQTLGSTLSTIEQRYGVDGDIVLGIWGLESNFGTAPLTYDAQEALATLAFEGRRRGQFENYLLALMQMVEQGLVTKDQLHSSWAGAMGQPQFMPDVYLATAVDGDGDGKRDIWTNRADVAASIANYLHDRGWQAGQPVFDEVKLPSGFNYALADGTSRTVTDWSTLGVRRIDGAAWTSAEMTLQSQLFLPAGATGPALLLHPNFAVIRRYNNSDRYALVVSLLARAFDGRPGLQARWPSNIGSLDHDQTFELQTLLNSVGYPAGTPDGNFGSNTRRAVRDYQTAHNQPADGFPTLTLLNALRAQAGITPDATPAPSSSSSSSSSSESEVHALDTAGIRALQRRLNRLGYHAGDADGSIGPDTRSAIRSFQRRHHMSITGRATTDVLEAARNARR